MEFEIITAFDKSFGIGKDGFIPWKIKEDLLHFKAITEKNIVVMGRKTYFSLPVRPLKNRFNIVLTNHTDNYENTENCIFTTKDNLNDLLKTLEADYKKCFICGGSDVYKMFLNDCNKLHITYIDKEYECDTQFPFFPSSLQLSEYTELQYSISEKCNYRYLTYIKGNNIESGEKVYLDLIKDILQNGNTRSDRTGTGTIGVFGRQLKFDISKTIPFLTTRQVSRKGIIKELLWFLKGNTDAKLLSKVGVNIWDANTTREFLDQRNLQHYEEGDIGPMYFYQIYHYNATYRGCNKIYDNEGLDQMAELINGLKNDPFSRRHLLTTYNPLAIKDSVLAPCHGIVIQFYVEEHDNQKYLSCHMYQRSVDVFLGLTWNIPSYALLTQIIALEVDMIPKELIISTGDTHLYLNHVEEAKLLLQRLPLPFPIVRINQKSIDKYEIDDFDIIGYMSHPPIKAKMAV